LLIFLSRKKYLPSLLMPLVSHGQSQLTYHCHLRESWSPFVSVIAFCWPPSQQSSQFISTDWPTHLLFLFTAYLSTTLEALVARTRPVFTTSASRAPSPVPGTQQVPSVYVELVHHIVGLWYSYPSTRILVLLPVWPWTSVVLKSVGLTQQNILQMQILRRHSIHIKSETLRVRSSSLCSKKPSRILMHTQVQEPLPESIPETQFIPVCPKG
jgi:hypothetical protein